MEQKLKRKDEYIRTLDLRADIQRQIAEKQRDYGKFPEAPEFLPDESTENERLEEYYKLRDLARSRLKGLVRRRDLQEVENIMFKDDIETLKDFNRFWGKLNDMLKGQSNLTANEFIEVWNKFYDVLVESDLTGIDVPRTVATVPPLLTYGPSMDPSEEKEVQNLIYELEKNEFTTLLKLNKTFNDVIDPTDDIIQGKYYKTYVNTSAESKPRIKVFSGISNLEKAKHIVRKMRNLPLAVSKNVEDMLDRINVVEGNNWGKYKKKGIKKHNTEFFAKRKGTGVDFDKIEPRYLPLGKYLLHMEQLRDGQLNLKTPAKAQIKTFPKKKVSTNFANILSKIVKGRDFSDSDYRLLSQPEKNLLHRTITISRFDKDEIPLLGGIIDTERDMLTNRFELLRGQLIAGNNNPEILQEIKPLIVKLISKNMIKKEEGMNILTMLCSV